MAKKTILDLLKMKEAGEKITQLTCYDYSTACLMNAAGVDTILVGDSLGMTMQGYDNTLPVTMDEMIVYGRSVVRGAKDVFVIADMPFGSYQAGVEQAVTNAVRLIKETGANAIKLEGGKSVAPQIKAITEAGIPVCAHIGMTPQSCNMFGGFKVQGKNEDNARRILEDAFAVQEAGAFMCVLECIPPKLANLITSKVEMITIGIGASQGCDGQVLVWQDMAGITQGFNPKFNRHFGEIGQAMIDAFGQYREAVKDGSFPLPEHTYAKSDCSDEILKALDNEYK